jgi:radical SAM-linked protein
MRVRLRYSKLGKVRFTSHRDVARLWERALRRAELPVATTQGFNPRPRLHFGLALSTGHESLAEYLDVDLRDEAAAGVDPATLPGVLTPLLPPGLTVEAAAVLDTGAPSLQQAVTHCTWWLDLPDATAAELVPEVARLLAAERLPVQRERKGRTVVDDLRPGILSLAVLGPAGPVTAGDGEPAGGPAGCVRLEAVLATQPRGIRPGELLSVFDPPRPDPVEEGGRVVRAQQWISAGGAAHEPLGRAGAATPAPHAVARAS